MKGTLIKTEQGWIVEFYLKVEGEIVGIDKFPLHPDQEKYMHLTGKKPNGSYINDGKEVDFIPIIDAKINMVQEFAKIVFDESDEEIEKQAKITSGQFIDWSIYETSAFILGAKWYREQIKSRQ